MVLAVAISLAPLASARETEGFSASLAPDGPIHVRGHLQTLPRYDFWTNVSVPHPHGPHPIVFEGEELVLTEYDVSPRGVRDRGFLASRDEPGARSFRHPVVYLESSRPDARWEALSRATLPTELGLRTTTQCDLARATDGFARFHGVPLEEAPAATDARWLELRCPASTLNITGDQALYVTNARLRIEFDNGTLPNGQPRRSSYHVDSGPRTVSDPFVPGRSYQLTRVARITTTDASAHFRLEAPGDVRVQAPRLLAVGQMTTPTGNGSVVWGASRWPGPELDPMTTDGAFLFAGEGERHINIDGQAFRPVVETPMAPFLPLDRPSEWGLAVAGLGLLALLFTRPWVALAPFFTRLTQDRALDHERRRAILETVQTNPGLRVQDASRLLRIHWSVVNYHVKVLARQGLLQRRRTGRETLLYVGHDLNASRIEEMRRLRHPTVQALLEAIEEKPTQTQAELAARIGVRQPRVSRLLHDLERLGVVRCERTPQGWSYHRVGAPSPVPSQDVRGAPLLAVS